MGIGNGFLLESCRNSFENQGWLHSIKQTLEINEMSNFYDEVPNSVYPFVYRKIFEKLIDNFHKTSFDQIKSESSKLRTYAIFKTEVGIEKYLTEMKNVADRILVTKFRLSNHRLMIEVGRHNNTPRDQRFCPFCPNLIEDEKHFLFTCPIFTHLRTRYLAPVCEHIRSYQYLPHDAKLQALMHNMESETCKFIASSMELRMFLISEPKNKD